MKYSICYLDKSGRTTRSEFSDFDADAPAVAHARGAMGVSFMAEIWKDGAIVERLLQPATAT